MKFYELKFSPNEVVSGSGFPQLELITQNHCLRSGEKPDVKGIEMRLNKGANETAFLSQASFNSPGFIVSQKIRVVFESLDTCPISFVPLIISNCKTKYFWAHIYNDERILNEINFERSDFVITEIFEENVPIKLTSLEGFLQKKREIGKMKLIEIKNIVLSNYFSNYDLFILPTLSSSVFLSEKGVKRLDGFEGVELNEYPGRIEN